MEKYKDLTDNELLALLKKYSIKHGPLLGSTRKLYEKKIYEYEKQRTQQHPSPGESMSYTGGTVHKPKVHLAEDELLARLRKYKLPHGPVVASTQKLYEKKIYEYENRQGQQHPTPGVSAPSPEPSSRQRDTQKVSVNSLSKENFSQVLEGSTMEKYKDLTDNELLALLKKYSIKHGPLLASTRKLYEKKIYEYENRQGQQHPTPGVSAPSPEPSSRQRDTQKVSVNSLSKENFSQVLEDIHSLRTDLKETIDSLKTKQHPKSGKEGLLYENGLHWKQAIVMDCFEVISAPGPIPIQNRQRWRSLLPKTGGIKYPQGMLPLTSGEMTDKLITETEPPQTSGNMDVRCHTPRWSGTQVASSPGFSQHEQQSQVFVGMALCSESIQITNQDLPIRTDGFPEEQGIGWVPLLRRPSVWFPATSPHVAREPPEDRRRRISVSGLNDGDGDAPSGSTMEEYAGLTDKELIARLKKYSIPHGPLVGTTRKLYEKKVYEYETERTQRPSPGKGSLSTEPPTSESYIRETFVSPQSRPNLNYGREALGSTRTYITENYDSPRTKEYYSDYINEGPSPTRSYLRENYRLPRHEGRSTYATEDWDANSSEASTSSYRSYVSSLTSGADSEALSARQPIAEPYPYNSSQKDVPSVRDSSSYQSIFHRKSSGLSSLGVEPRRAIHPQRQTQAAEGATGGDAGTRRYLPLWPQLFLFVLLAGFLAFIYFVLREGADDNPFSKFLQP